MSTKIHFTVEITEADTQELPCIDDDTPKSPDIKAQAYAAGFEDGKNQLQHAFQDEQKRLIAAIDELQGKLDDAKTTVILTRRELENQTESSRRLLEERDSANSDLDICREECRQLKERIVFLTGKPGDRLFTTAEIKKVWLAFPADNSSFEAFQKELERQ